MPPVRNSRNAPPAGWDAISDTIQQINQKITDYDTADTSGLRKNEMYVSVKICYNTCKFDVILT